MFLGYDGTNLWTNSINSSFESSGNGLTILSPTTGAVIASVNTTNGPYYFTSDGQHMWVSENNNTLEEFSFSGALLGTFPLPSPNGISGPLTNSVFDDTNLWIFNVSYITEFNTLIGTVVQNIPETTGSVHGIAWDGANIWYDLAAVLYRYNLSSASQSGTITNPLGTQWKSMAFDGTYLWVTTANGYISQIDPVAGVILNTINESAIYPQYATFDGSHYVWVADVASGTLIRLQVK